MEINRVSDIPIDDKVLTRNGNVVLSSGSVRVIQELSELLLRTRFSVVEGAFNCASAACLQEGPFTSCAGDRPFSYYYAASQRTLKGFVFHNLTLGSSGDTRTVTFVKLGGEADLPEDLRNRLIYLLHLPEGEVFQEDATKLLPLK